MKEEAAEDDLRIISEYLRSRERRGSLVIPPEIAAILDKIDSIGLPAIFLKPEGERTGSTECVPQVPATVSPKGVHNSTTQEVQDTAYLAPSLPLESDQVQERAGGQSVRHGTGDALASHTNEYAG
ncbi:hypothetical protein SCP_0313080 [Sparassis crispa]|uniref:Uncharacterized protein n=1 Tax=Sparassis crispa TaxID=139825 RepID=A0A401GHD7_9APHY|nr:hypothetical protein SCP_0313080 [Sparassis crispa]GBE81579.1 hypothetical protein SCP_0313080 [Sparassis crispa]